MLTFRIFVVQMPEERNYHIFYRLLCGLTKEEKASLHLTVANDYHYLSQGNCFTCEGMDDAQEFANFQTAMKVLVNKINMTKGLVKENH